HIMSPNLNDDAIKKELVAALVRGTTVKMVLGKGFNAATERMPLQGGTNDKTVRELYSELERQGVKNPQERLQIRWYSMNGGTPTAGASDGRSHLKYQSIAGQLAIAGSGILDTQSLNHSGEANVVVDSQHVVGAWDRQIFAP